MHPGSDEGLGRPVPSVAARGVPLRPVQLVVWEHREALGDHPRLQAWLPVRRTAACVVLVQLESVGRRKRRERSFLWLSKTKATLDIVSLGHYQ